MKSGKIILGAAALVVTAGSVLAFKAHSSFRSGAKKIMAATVNGGNCKTALSCWTTAGQGGGKPACHTLGGSHALQNNAFTARTATHNLLCSSTHQLSKWTTTH